LKMSKILNTLVDIYFVNKIILNLIYTCLIKFDISVRIKRVKILR